MTDVEAGGMSSDRYSSTGWVGSSWPPAASPGKCRSEERTDALDPRDRALAEATLPVMLLHAPAHGLPLVLIDARGDATVGDDLHHPVGHQHVNEDAIVVGSVPDA